MSITRHTVLQNNTSELPKLAATVEAFAEQTGLDMKLQFNLNLALDELVTNIIHYAYDDDLPHQIHVSLSYTDNLLCASLIDDGKAFDPTDTRAPDLETDIENRQVGGLGIHFVKSLTDRMEYQRKDGKNHLILWKTTG